MIKNLTITTFLFLFFSCTRVTTTPAEPTKEIELAVDSNARRDIEPLKPYAELKQETADKKAIFLKTYNAAKGNKAIQDSVISEAQKYLIDISDEYFKSWYNTPWTFHGHTETPRKGSIACGYFVSTTLRDMGFKIHRIKWAQQVSEYMILKLSTDIKRFSNRPMSEIVDYIESQGEGLYIVGLDCHVGYIYYHNGDMRFVHSNYYKKNIGVMSEPMVGRNPLNDSKLKIIGKIFDREMTLNWIQNTPYSE